MMTGDLNTLCPNVLAPAKAVHVSSIQLLSQDYIEVAKQGVQGACLYGLCARRLEMIHFLDHLELSA